MAIKGKASSVLGWDELYGDKLKWGGGARECEADIRGLKHLLRYEILHIYWLLLSAT